MLGGVNDRGQGIETIDLNGNGIWNISGCVHTNGNLVVQNPSQLISQRIQAVSNIRCTATTTQVCAAPHTQGGLYPGSPWANDPLATVVPDLPAENASAAVPFDTAVVAGNGTISPGWYRGPYNEGNNRAQINFNPGVYYFINDGQPVNAGGNWVGSNVTLAFYGSGERLIMRNAGQLNLTAPVNGVYQGVLVYYSRHFQDAVFAMRASAGNPKGTFYLPTGQLRFDNNVANRLLTNRVITKTLSNQNTAFTINVDETTNRQW